MKIAIDDIKEFPKELSYTEEVNDLNARLDRGVRDYRVARGPDVAVEYYRAGLDVFFRGVLRGEHDGLGLRLQTVAARDFGAFESMAKSSRAARTVDPPTSSRVRRMASRSISSSVAPGMSALAASSGPPERSTAGRCWVPISRPSLRAPASSTAAASGIASRTTDDLQRMVHARRRSGAHRDGDIDVAPCEKLKRAEFVTAASDGDLARALMAGRKWCHGPHSPDRSADRN